MQSITNFLKNKEIPAPADAKPLSEVLVVSPPTNVWDPTLTEVVGGTEYRRQGQELLLVSPDPTPPVSQESPITSSVMEQMKGAIEAHRILKNHQRRVKIRQVDKRKSIRREIRMKMQKASRRMNSRHK